MGSARLALPLLAWLAGVAFELQQATLPSSNADVAIGAFAFVALATGLAWRHRFGIGTAFLAAGAMGAAFALADGRAASRLSETLAPSLEGRDIVLTGIVASLPQQGASGLRFRFEVEDSAGAAVPRTLALGWYAGFHEDAAQADRKSTRLNSSHSS